MGICTYGVKQLHTSYSLGRSISIAPRGKKGSTLKMTHTLQGWKLNSGIFTRPWSALEGTDQSVGPVSFFTRPVVQAGGGVLGNGPDSLAIIRSKAPFSFLRLGVGDLGGKGERLQ